MRDDIRFFLNGRPHVASGSDVFLTLSEYLRDRLRMVGTKVVCAEGDCGACTVLVGRADSNSRISYGPVDSCIIFVAQLDAANVVTVEGLADGNALHPVQRAMVECHGSQCGYCTPGFVMALAAWAEAGADPASVKQSLTGNLCRCTGYLPILEAAESISRTPPPPILEPLDKLGTELSILAADAVRVEADGRTFFAPKSLAEAVEFKASGPEVVVLSGATELGVLRNKRGYEPRSLLSLARITGLGGIEFDDNRVSVGANATWTDIERDLLPRLPAFGPIVRRFGSPQIRNVATLAGNVVNGSPIADALPLLMVLDADLEITGTKGTRHRPLNGFYTGYKRTDLATDELLTRITFTLPAANERLRLYKVSRRTDLDIATVGAAVRVHEADGVIRRVAVAYSGVGPTVARSTAAEASLIGQPFSEETFGRAGRAARAAVSPLSDVRGSKDYRGQLVENILVKFYHEESA